MSFQKHYAFDAAPGLLKRDVAQAALTGDAYVGTQYDQVAATNTALVCIINVESCKVSAGDEGYTFRVVCSNQADRSDSRVVACRMLGDAAAKTVDTVDDVASDQIAIFFETEVTGIEFRYVDLHLDVEGTSPSIGFSAFMTKFGG